MATTAKVLGRLEIAQLLEVDSRTPHMWMSRKLLPDPDHPSVNGSPAWDRDTVIEWAIKTGRCPEGLRQEWDPEQHIAASSRRGGRENKKRYGNA